MNSRQLRKNNAISHNKEFERLKNRTPEERKSDFEEEVHQAVRISLANIKDQLFESTH